MMDNWLVSDSSNVTTIYVHKSISLGYQGFSTFVNLEVAYNFLSYKFKNKWLNNNVYCNEINQCSYSIISNLLVKFTSYEKFCSMARLYFIPSREAYWDN